ncbi:hypothetical protein TWF506_008904 [Arthrobotrys conoides]|uniref:Uncharacterized protein n=1 Tax=Arthrobotrys conoides TaxID=74498 RepID=A0AAN8N806_9PEZI
MFTYIASLFRASKPPPEMPPPSNNPPNNPPSEEIFKLTSPSSSTSSSPISLPQIPAPTAIDFAYPSTPTPLTWPPLAHPNAHEAPQRAHLSLSNPVIITSKPTKTQRPRLTIQTSNLSDYNAPQQYQPREIQSEAPFTEYENFDILPGASSTDGVFDRPPSPIHPMIHPSLPPTAPWANTMAVGYAGGDGSVKEERDSEIRALQQGCLLQRVCCFCCPNI